MKLESIAGNVAHAIMDHRSDHQSVMAIEFTDKETKGKPANGCLVVTLVDATHYSIKSYDSRFLAIDKSILDMELAAFLECDDDLDQRQTMVDTINQLVSDNPNNLAQLAE